VLEAGDHSDARFSAPAFDASLGYGIRITNRTGKVKDINLGNQSSSLQQGGLSKCISTSQAYTPGPTPVKCFILLACFHGLGTKDNFHYSGRRNQRFRLTITGTSRQYKLHSERRCM
jgi:hypothetical protein